MNLRNFAAARAAAEGPADAVRVRERRARHARAAEAALREPRV